MCLKNASPAGVSGVYVQGWRLTNGLLDLSHEITYGDHLRRSHTCGDDIGSQEGGGIVSLVSVLFQPRSQVTESAAG